MFCSRSTETNRAPFFIAARKSHPASSLTVSLIVRYRLLCIVMYMELIQGARNRQELKKIKNFLTNHAFQTVPLTARLPPIVRF